jgi:hypothetical protein
MADKKIQLKRNNAGTIDNLFPVVRITDAVGSDGITSFLDAGKIRLTYLPNSVFDSLYFYSTIDDEFPAALKQLARNANDNTAVANRSMLGYYWVAATTTLALTSNATGEQVNDTGKYFITSFSNGESGSASNVAQTLEIGDWIVISKVSGGDGATAGTAINVVFAIVNNTYELATTAIDGIVRLSSSTSTSTTGDAVITNGILAGLIGTASTQIAAGNHLHAGVYQPLDGDLTALAALSGTGFVKRTGTDTYSLDTATYLTAQSLDFGVVTVVDTDSGHTYATNGSATADVNADTLTLVDGDGIDIDVSTTTDAIRIQHSDTSTLTGAQGTAGIAAITVDGYGHVTAVTTATYNNYALPLAANGTRGGIQIGATETETNRAVILTSEKASIGLPRQIPAVTLNNASSTAPNFYAPTTSGTTSSTSQVKQRLNGVTGAAPTWIDSPNIYYDTTTGATHGDIIFDEVV